MKKFPLILSLITAVAFLITGCDRDYPVLATVNNVPSSQALIKVVYASPYAKNPSVQLKFNDTRVSSGMTYTYPFPGGGLNTGGASDPLYFPADPGALKVSLSIPNVGNNTDSVNLYSTTVNLEGGKVYTLHLSDTAANTQATLLTENFNMPDTGVTRYRFVNLIPNLAALDLYFGTTLVAANVPYQAASPEFELSRMLPGAKWEIRPAGAPPTSTALYAYPTGAALYTVPNRRVMTVYARGYNGVSSTDIRRPMISLFYVR